MTRAGRSRAPRYQRPTDYVLADPQLRAYHHGLGTLSVDGAVEGYLASTVGEMLFPRGEQWALFVVVWLDGTKERSFEDYGPWWLTVRELDAGYLQHYGPSLRSQHRILWKRVESSVLGEARRFDFAWLPADEASRMWRELGIADTDF